MGFPRDATAETTKRPRILLAEDDASLRTLVAESLRRDGYEIIEARDGSELMEHLASSMTDTGDPSPLDLVVSDVRMPGWTGLEVLRGARLAGCKASFVIITAFGDDLTHAEARDLDAAVVLDKPFDMSQLRTAVHLLAPRPASGKPCPGTLRILLAEDDGRLRSMLTDALRRDGHVVVELRSGTELLEHMESLGIEGSGECQYDVLITDVRMPGWSGLEALDGLRLAGSEVPIVVMTAFVEPETRNRVRSLGGATVFGKPFDVNDLRTLLMNLPLWRATRPLARR